MIQKSSRANDTALLGSVCHWKGFFRCSPKIRYTCHHTIMKSLGGQPPFSKSFQSPLQLTESKALEPFVFKLRKLSLVARSQCQQVTYRSDLQGNNSPCWIGRGNSEVCFSLSRSCPSTFSWLDLTYSFYRVRVGLCERVNKVLWMVNHHMDIAETVQVEVRGKLVRDNSCSGSTNCCTSPATKVSLVLLGTLKC